MDPLLGSSLISGAGSLISGLFGGSSSKKIAKMQTQAAKEMNERNVASQEAINAANVASAEKINQMQIDFQQGINDMMRYDSKHAISDKKSDLVRAGYSMADPSLQGFSAASLGGISPQIAQQVAPHVQSEFDGSAAANVINARNSTINSILSSASTASTIALQKAQARSQNANASVAEIDAAWKDVQNKANLEKVYQDISESVSRNELNKKQGVKLLKDLDVLDMNLQTMREQLSQLKFQTSTQEQRFIKEMAQLDAIVSDLNSSASFKDSQRALTDLQAKFQKIKNDYAEVGINFDDNNIVSSLLKLAASGHSEELIGKVVDGLKGVFVGFFKSLFDTVDEGLDSIPRNVPVDALRGMPLAGVVGGVVNAIKEERRRKKN